MANCSDGSKPSLKVLCKEVLGLAIQEGVHSFLPDTRSTLLLYKSVAEEWQVLKYSPKCWFKSHYAMSLLVVQYADNAVNHAALGLFAAKANYRKSISASSVTTRVKRTARLRSRTRSEW